MKKAHHLSCIRYLVYTFLLFFSCKTETPEQQIPIMAWYGPSADSVNRNDLLSIRAAGFNRCLIDLKKSELNTRALLIADSVGLALFLTDQAVERYKSGQDSTLYLIDSLVTVYNSYQSNWGCFLYNKPGLADFPSISTLVDYFNSKHPSHHYFIHANPEYVSAATLDTTIYADYLALFVDKLKPRFMSYEHYAIVKETVRPEFFSNLAQIRQVSLDYNVPFWAYALVVSFNSHPEVQHSHVRVQLYAGLAYGARGIQYYSFRPPTDNLYEYGDAMLSHEGDPTKAYSFIRMINAEIQKLGPTLMRLRSTGVFFSEPVPPGGVAFKPGLPIIKINAPSILAGFFVDESNQKYVMFVNTDFSYGKRARIHFSEHVKSLVEVPKNYMPPLIIQWDDELYKDADILFKAGDGRLFRIVE
ncbi:hypothetical protein EH223_01955 [candidate division KSB1 bacterium]|nr:hypothetical protein [candidate division KSB1 bacterium]RQW06750.1 MAG: hypothetical protein EH223_01955 [candidate division KSB1 bacterium]